MPMNQRNVPGGVARSLAQVLETRAQEAPDSVAFVFLRDGESDEEVLRYGDFDRRARALGRELTQAVGSGQRAVLLYPPGLDYVVALFACFASGVVPVPAYPPDPTRLHRTLPRLQAILDDAEAAVVLTTTGIEAAKDVLFEIAPGLRNYRWMATDTDHEYQPWSARAVAEDDLVLLQYTSGSAGSPKGVIITNKNLMSNLETITTTAYEYTSSSVVVSWLPHYHDMGLIGGIFASVYAGCRSILLSPLDFLQKPVRWLNAISKYRGTITAAPNFAFDLCVRKSSAEERRALDLSSVRVCLDAAEPVHAKTIDRFVETFGAAGFRRTMIRPSYGLAEATLLVTTGRIGTAPLVVQEGAEGPARVSCGRAVDQDVLIVDPESRVPCKDGHVGEIWVRGPHVGKGYWRNAEETEKTFRGALAAGDGPFLRTGDLGFARGEDVFVTGRLKDMIIVRGRNHYPSDLEKTAEECHPALRRGCGAAFSVEVGEEEQVVLVYECEDRPGVRLNEVAALIYQSILVLHDLAVEVVVLVKPRTIPKTSSGKLMRPATREAHLAGTLEVLATWKKPDHAEIGAKPVAEDSLRGWLMRWCAESLRLAVEQIDPAEPLASYGLNSMAAVKLAEHLSAKVGYRVAASLLFDYPSIDSLCAYLEASGGPRRRK